MSASRAGAAEESVDVVVVGAGLAGLVAARAVRAAGRSVVVLEARERVGGRIFGAEVSGAKVEFGGTWTGPGQHRLKALAEDLGVAFTEPFTDGASVYRRCDERLLIPAGRSRRDYSGVVDAAELTAAVRELDEMGAQVPPDCPWRAEAAETWDRQTFHAWLGEHVSTPVAEALTHVHEGYLGRPSESSLLHTVFYIYANGGFASLMGLGREAHDSQIFVGGASELPSRLAAELGERVRLRSPVSGIVQDERGVEVTGEDFRLRARVAILALAPVLATRLRYRPALPYLRDHYAQRMPIRGKIRIAAVYPEPFWRGDGLCGTATGDFLTAWDSGLGEAPGALTVMTGIDVSRRLWAMPAADRRRAILEELARCFGPRAADPIGYREVYWQAEEFSRGCVSYCGPGVWTGYGPGLREPVGRIHWAGAEAAAAFPGNMEGAVRSGEDAAARVLGEL